MDSSLIPPGDSVPPPSSAEVFSLSGGNTAQPSHLQQQQQQLEGKYAFPQMQSQSEQPVFDPTHLFDEDEDSKKNGRKRANKDIKDEIKTAMKRLSKEEIAKNQALILKLTRYGTSSRFSEYLKENGFKLKPSDLNKMNSEELQELLERVTVCVANKCETSIFTSGILFGVQIVEDVTQRSSALKDRFDLLGYRAFLEKDETFMDAVEEIRISTSLVSGLSPQMRLLVSMAKGAAFTSGSNAKAKRDVQQWATSQNLSSQPFSKLLPKQQPQSSEQQLQPDSPEPQQEQEQKPIEPPEPVQPEPVSIGESKDVAVNQMPPPLTRKRGRPSTLQLQVNVGSDATSSSSSATSNDTVNAGQKRRKVVGNLQS